jgi:hypothetical protein
MPALTVFNESDRLKVPPGSRHNRSSMRLRAALIVPFVAVLAAQAAGARQTSSAQFLVSLRATVTKQWTYTATRRPSSDCRERIAGRGERTVSLRSRDVSVVIARWAGGRARVKFAGNVGSLGATVVQRGTKTTRSSGGAECTQGTDRRSCPALSRRVVDLHGRLVSGRLHKLSFGRIRGVVPPIFFNDCPGEPVAVRSVSAGLGLADASFSERDLFDRNVGGLTLQGTADADTTLLNGSASIVQRVHWTLTLRRLGA